MPEIGYALSSEEHPPDDLVRNAQRAEEAGFTFALISDHYHPWVSAQGHSPFVWSVIGAIAQATDELRLGTGVTCPTMRIHPTIMAQAAATSAAMMPRRFFFGVGTGENLNEHVQGERWRPFDLRLAMLEEALEIIRMLWEGETVSYWGDYYIVEDARLFTLPDTPPPIYVAASGENMAEAAGYLGDGFITTAPKQELLKAYNDGGGDGPKIGQLTVCWAPDKETAKETVYKIWPNSGLPGELTQELRTVEHFEQAVKAVSKEEAVKGIVTGPDAQEHIDGIQEFVDAGFDQVYIHQIGHEQDGFFEFYTKEILPHFQS
ncbi:MAG: TIGR03557 family F420-dependent LLM class oxidoreductase [Anaerolineae bacterium]|nr:TIGR03557 family F420-dependent LLM class oxidoreductase [Anaerolineae bacterium]